MGSLSFKLKVTIPEITKFTVSIHLPIVIITISQLDQSTRPEQNIFRNLPIITAIERRFVGQTKFKRVAIFILMRMHKFCIPYDNCGGWKPPFRIFAVITTSNHCGCSRAQQYIPLGEEPPRDVPLMSWWCGDCEHGRSIRWLWHKTVVKLINSLRVLLQIELIAIRKIYGATCAELDGNGTYWEGHVPGLGLLLPRQTDRQARGWIRWSPL